MKLYALVHIYDGSLVDGGVQLNASTIRSNMEDEMYRQLEEALKALQELHPEGIDEYGSDYCESLGFAYISHLELDANDSTREVFDHEWRIVEL